MARQRYRADCFDMRNSWGRLDWNCQVKFLFLLNRKQTNSHHCRFREAARLVSGVRQPGGVPVTQSVRTGSADSRRMRLRAPALPPIPEHSEFSHYETNVEHSISINEEQDGVEDTRDSCPCLPVPHIRVVSANLRDSSPHTAETFWSYHKLVVHGSCQFSSFGKTKHNSHHLPAQQQESLDVSSSGGCLVSKWTTYKE